jgi:uncharacterized protein
MHQKLPREIDPFRLAQNGLVIEGQIQLSELPRFTQFLLSDEGIVDVKLAFEIDEIGTPYMKGEFKTSVSILCQRCMSEMTLDMHVHSLLGLVKSELKIEGLAEQYEPWVLETADPVLTSSLIEDELILALPIVPKHEQPCLSEEAWSVGDDEVIDETDKKESPFAILSALKKTKE